MATTGGSFGTRVVMNGPALATLLRSPSGPVVRALIKFGDVVKEEAIKECPQHDPVPGERRSRAPGTLKRSIVKRVVQEGDGVAVLVGSDDPVALYVHEGTQPHEIRGNPTLVFYWKRLGRVVGFGSVQHPGTRPNRFLIRALNAARGRVR